MKRYLIAAALMAQASPALADTLYDKCVNATDTNYGWAECGGAYLKRADAALNAAWKQIFAGTTGKTRADLLKEQRAWIAYKDASCNFYSNGDWGREGEVLHFYGCRGAVIEHRTAELTVIRETTGH